MRYGGSLSEGLRARAGTEWPPAAPWTRERAWEELLNTGSEEGDLPFERTNSLVFLCNKEPPHVTFRGFPGGYLPFARLIPPHVIGDLVHCLSKGGPVCPAILNSAEDCNRSSVQ